jgi:hypothetical protein
LGAEAEADEGAEQHQRSQNPGLAQIALEHRPGGRKGRRQTRDRGGQGVKLAADGLEPPLRKRHHVGFRGGVGFDRWLGHLFSQPIPHLRIAEQVDQRAHLLRRRRGIGRCRGRGRRSVRDRRSALAEERSAEHQNGDEGSAGAPQALAHPATAPMSPPHEAPISSGRRREQLMNRMPARNAALSAASSSRGLLPAPIGRGTHDGSPLPGSMASNPPITPLRWT